MEEAIEILTWNLNRRIAVRDTWANDEEEDLSELVQEEDVIITQLTAAIEHLQNAVFIDKEPLNTLLVNALRHGDEVQRLLIKNIVERNAKLRVKKDPRVDGVPKINEATGVSTALIVWTATLGFRRAVCNPKSGAKCWFLGSDLGWLSTDEILFYADPEEIV